MKDKRERDLRTEPGVHQQVVWEKGRPTQRGQSGQAQGAARRRKCVNEKSVTTCVEDCWGPRNM